tara:strand:- start:147 stop:662 length:516 start_codon:yes stop_codon:yes gene_type:complete
VSDLVQNAKEFATQAHEGQARKYTGIPYIVHPSEVMGIVSTVEHDDAMLAAALLHDVVEDTDHTVDDIRAEFGDDVAELVSALTDVSTIADGNRKSRKAKDRAHTAGASPRAQTIKLADLLSNSVDIIKNDPDFARIYMAEKLLLLGVLQEGDQTLLARALHLVGDYYESR